MSVADAAAPGVKNAGHTGSLWGGCCRFIAWGVRNEGNDGAKVRIFGQIVPIKVQKKNGFFFDKFLFVGFLLYLCALEHRCTVQEQ